MSLTYISRDKIIPLDTLIINRVANSIIAKSSLKDEAIELELNLSFDLNLVIDDYLDTSQVEEETFLFYNKYYKQSDIIEISSKNLRKLNRLGYFFSKNILFDKDETYEWDNKFLVTAAFRAIIALVQGNCETTILQPNIDNLDRLDLELFYPEFDSILVLNLIDIEKIIDFDFQAQYSIQLRKFGFFLINNSSEKNSILNNPISKELFDNLIESNGIKKLNLYPLNEFCISNDYIQRLFSEILNKNSVDVSRFILLYQVIEILMDIVYRKELRINVIDQFEAHNSYTLKNKVVEITNEKKRINKLFNKFSKISPDIKINYEPILEKFLTALSMKIKDIDIPEKFYEVRNGLTHNYRSLYENGPKLSIEDWDDFLALTEIMIIELLENLNLAK